MNRARHAFPVAALAAGLLLVASVTPVAADGGRKPAPADPVWQEECGSCHVAYPPRMLPADSWRRLMQGLGDHFGSDASLEPQRVAAIEAFLVGNARKPKKGGTTEAPLRITESKWFRGEHREVAATKWRSPAVGSPANCGACHAKAEQGRFAEKDIRIP